MNSFCWSQTVFLLNYVRKNPIWTNNLTIPVEWTVLCPPKVFVSEVFPIHAENITSSPRSALPHTFEPTLEIVCIFRVAITTVEGAQTTLYCALEESLATSTGKYYEHLKEHVPPKLMLDGDLCRRVYDVTYEAVKEYAKIWDHTPKWLDLYLGIL